MIAWEVHVKLKGLIAAVSAAILDVYFVAASGAYAQTNHFVASGATPQPVSFDLGGGAAGGPSVDSDGNVYFTLTLLGANKTGSIQKWDSATGKVTKYKEVDGGAIGTAIDTKGRLLVGEWTAERITIDDLKGHVTVLVDLIDGRKLLDPNAIIADRRGGIYFTESGDSSASELSGIDYIQPNEKSAKRVATLRGARKVILSPDGNTLIASGAGNKLWKYTVAADGSLADQKEFCSDKCANPVAFDESGNVYMLGDQLLIYSLQREQLAAIPMPIRFSNAAFAGGDRKTLFMTGHDGMYTLRMATRGAPSALDLERSKK